MTIDITDLILLLEIYLIMVSPWKVSNPTLLKFVMQNWTIWLGKKPKISKMTTNLTKINNEQ